MTKLTPQNDPTSLPALPGEALLPSLVVHSGKRAGYRFLEFFAAHIRNPNTREAYFRAVAEFFHWCELRGVPELSEIRSHHVAAYIELLTKSKAAPTTKQRLAAIRMLFDWLIIGQVVPSNPAQAVRGPKHVIEKGKTPVLEPELARKLLDSIRTDTAVGLRDRALIGLLVYTFARVSAALTMNVGDYYPQGKRWWIRLHEKGGKYHEMPAHHELEEFLDAYLTAAGFGDAKKAPLFRSARGKTGQLTAERMHRVDAWRMIRRRAKEAGILTPIGNHTFRATGITAYLLNGGELEKAQKMAAHSSPRTTKLYDRRNDQLTLDEVEKIILR